MFCTFTSAVRVSAIVLLGGALILGSVSIARSQTPSQPQPPPSPGGTAAAAPAATDSPTEWRHLRLAASVNISHDASRYDGPRSSYLTTSWTTRTGTLFHGRIYLDNYVPRLIADQEVQPTFVLRESVKEAFVRRKFANGLVVTAGDIRATAHSDNNKTLYSGDGKPLHSSIVEIDRVLGASVGKTWPAATVEFTLADRGRKDLRWSGLMEAVRVSRASADARRDLQATFVNRNGRDTRNIQAPHQWQTGIGGSYTTFDRRNKVSAEYVHGNFLPGRTLSSDAFSVTYEWRLIASGAAVIVGDYEHVDGKTGVEFFELGLGFNVLRLGGHAYVRAEGGAHLKDPVSPSEREQHGIFGRLGLVFDRGAGAVKVPATLTDRPAAN
jgi:hypothetical protein